MNATLLLTACVVLLLYAVAPAKADELETAYRTIAYEARGDGLESQIMVAKCIKERVRVRGQSIKEVVFARDQFSCYDRSGKPVQKHKLTEKELETAKKAWELSEMCNVPTNLYARHDTKAAKLWRATAEVHKQYYAPGQTRIVYLGRFGSHDHFTEIRPQWRKYYKKES
jgi:hypothetical protein